MFYKQCRVEHVPLGVVGTIVPWNYPFHNILNPLLAALFAGNGLVVKVSEHASWSSRAYQQFIDSVLAAAGAPAGLVTIVTGAFFTTWSPCAYYCSASCPLPRGSRGKDPAKHSRPKSPALCARRMGLCALDLDLL